MAIWKSRKSAFGAIGRLSPTYCTQDGVVPRTKLPEILRYIVEVGKRHDLRIANVFHAGDGNIHPILLFDERDQEQVKRVLLASHEILDKCIELGGSVTGEHGIGVEKMEFMPKLFSPEDLAAMVALRQTFNPDGRCNPSKMLPGGAGCIERSKPGRGIPAATVPNGLTRHWPDDPSRRFELGRPPDASSLMRSLIGSFTNAFTSASKEPGMTEIIDRDFDQPVRVSDDMSAQVGGNIAFAQNSGRARAEGNERKKRVLSKEELPPTATTTFVDASVLMNVPADEYVAIFGVRKRGNRRGMQSKNRTTIKEFTDELTTSESPTMHGSSTSFRKTRSTASRWLARSPVKSSSGFELKKNISIDYKDKALLDRIVVAAAHVADLRSDQGRLHRLHIDAIEDKLMEEASRIIKRKASRYEKLLDIKLQPPAQVIAEKSSMYHPTEMYDSYTAFETEHVNMPANRDRLTTQTARKSRTFFWNSLDPDGFDVGGEPGGHRARSAIHALSQGEVRGEADQGEIGSLADCGRALTT